MYQIPLLTLTLFLLSFPLTNSVVITGLGNLANSGYSILKGTTVGIVSNPTGIFPNLTHMVDAMVTQTSFNLVAVFGPEHGFRGDQQAGEDDDYYIDPQTGLPVYSIYGMSPSSMVTVLLNTTATTIIYDIQEVGTRFYTYIWTMWNMMQACAKLNYTYIVLDRPAATGGAQVSGPVLQPGFESGVGELPIALNYGMTIGELANLFANHFLPPLNLRVNLIVVQLSGWKRGLYYDGTGLPWVMPSPNMPTLDTAIAYVGFGFFEGTNCSEGRGTTRPFELIGAPFITLLNNNKTSFAGYLNALPTPIPGATFREAFFDPTFSKYEGISIAGTQLYVTDRNQFDGVYSALVWLIEAHKLYSDFDWLPPSTPGTPYWIDYLAGTDMVRKGIDANMTITQLQAQWANDLSVFSTLRLQYLLY